MDNTSIKAVSGGLDGALLGICRQGLRPNKRRLQVDLQFFYVEIAGVVESQCCADDCDLAQLTSSTLIFSTKWPRTTIFGPSMVSEGYIFSLSGRFVIH